MLIIVMLIFLIILILIITSIYSIYITINHHNYDKRGIEYKYIKNVFLTHIGGFILVGLMLYVNKEILFKFCLKLNVFIFCLFF